MPRCCGQVLRGCSNPPSTSHAESCAVELRCSTLDESVVVVLRTVVKGSHL